MGSVGNENLLRVSSGLSMSKSTTKENACVCEKVSEAERSRRRGVQASEISHAPSFILSHSTLKKKPRRPEHVKRASIGRADWRKGSKGSRSLPARGMKRPWWEGEGQARRVRDGACRPSV